MAATVAHGIEQGVAGLAVQFGVLRRLEEGQRGEATVTMTCILGQKAAIGIG